MDHLSALTDQHRTIRGLNNTLSKTGDTATRNRILRQIRDVMDTHFFIEESILFPMLARYEVLQSWSAVLWESHDTIQSRLTELSRSTSNDISFSLAQRVFEQELESHFGDEETHVFPNIRLLVPYPELLEIQTKIAEAQSKAKAA